MMSDEIRDTLNSYNDEYTVSDAYDDLACTMHEVRQHIVFAARTLIEEALAGFSCKASMQEALAKASRHLFFALTAWEPDPGSILTKCDRCPECRGYGNLYTAVEEDGIAAPIDCPTSDQAEVADND